MGLERDLSDGLPDDAAEPTPIFVCGAARTHVVHFPAGAAVGDLRVAVKRMGYSAGENGLCVVGGAPLPLDDRLTLAQCGIRANSSVQVAGRLRGGVEVTIRGRQHTVDARGHLDLRNHNLGPAEVKEVAAFLATSAGGAINLLTLGSTGNMRDQKTYTLTAGEEKIDLSQKNLGSADVTLLTVWLQRPEVTGALNSVTLDSNGIFGTLGRRGEPDKFVGDCDAFLAALKESNILTLSLQNTGIGPLTLRKLATSLPAAVASLCCANNPGMVGELDDWGRLKKPDVQAEVFKQLTDSLKTSKVTEVDFSSCGIGPVALGHLSDLVRDATGAVNSMTVDGNDIFGTKRYFPEAKHKYLDMSGWKAMCEAMKTSSTITSFSAADVDMNPEAAALLADAIKLMGALTSVVLDENELTGTKIKYKGQSIEEIEELDADLSGFTEFCSSLKSSTIVSLSLRKCYLGPQALDLLSDAIKFIGAVARLGLSGNMITGSRNLAEPWENPNWEYDTDLSGLISLCDALPTLKNPIELDLSNCGLSVNGINPLAKAISAGGAVTSINCLANKFGEEDLATLLTAIEGTSVRSLCGLTEGQTTADFSGQNLGPIDMKIMAAEYGFQGFIGALTSINCLANKFGEDDLATLLTAIEGTSIRSLCGLTEGQTTADFSGQNLGPIDCKIIAAEYGFRGFIGAINLLTLDSTGNMTDQKTYTLTAGEEKIDLSQKNLGSADVALLTVWLQRPEVSGALNSILLSGNPLTGGGVDSNGQVHSAKDWNGSKDDLSGLVSLCEALPELKNPITLDLSNCGLSENGVNPVAKAISAGGAVTSINCLHNPLGEAVHIIIKVFEETPRLRTL
eukprot:COSAG03_NODE_1584_length_3837_cov_19.773408_4_plen_850_part_01